MDCRDGTCQPMYCDEVASLPFPPDERVCTGTSMNCRCRPGTKCSGNPLNPCTLPECTGAPGDNCDPSCGGVSQTCHCGALTPVCYKGQCKVGRVAGWSGLEPPTAMWAVRAFSPAPARPPLCSLSGRHGFEGHIAAGARTSTTCCILASKTTFTVAISAMRQTGAKW